MRSEISHELVRLSLTSDGVRRNFAGNFGLPQGGHDHRRVQPGDQSVDTHPIALHDAGLRPRHHDRALGDTAIPHALAASALLVLTTLDSLRSSVMVRVGCWLNDRLGPVFLASSIRAQLQGDTAGAQPLRDLAQIQNFIASQGLTVFFDAPWVDRIRRVDLASASCARRHRIRHCDPASAPQHHQRIDHAASQSQGQSVPDPGDAAGRGGDPKRRGRPRHGDASCRHQPMAGAEWRRDGSDQQGRGAWRRSGWTYEVHPLFCSDRHSRCRRVSRHSQQAQRGHDDRCIHSARPRPRAGRNCDDGVAKLQCNPDRIRPLESALERSRHRRRARPSFRLREVIS